MIKFPKHVNLIEVGPRDGFQAEEKIIPTALKLEIIEILSDAGLGQIQVTSFVHPERVAQMADAEEVCRRLPESSSSTFTGLVLNTHGVKRALEAGIENIDISISTSETHSKKNVGMDLKRSWSRMSDAISVAKNHRVKVTAGIQCAFGCAYEGEIPSETVKELAKKIIDLNVDMFFLADTTGMANPILLKKRLYELAPIIGDIPIVLHLHDTRGMGLANVLTALECGITSFDTSFGGMGGCPFIPNASGNISTEDTAFFLHSMGIETGINIDKVIECTRKIERFLKKSLPGKIHKLGGVDVS